MLELYLRIINWVKREEGQDLVEYALILGLIALLATAALTIAGQEVRAIWNAIVTELQSASPV